MNIVVELLCDFNSIHLPQRLMSHYTDYTFALGLSCAVQVQPSFVITYRLYNCVKWSIYFDLFPSRIQHMMPSLVVSFNNVNRHQLSIQHVIEYYFFSVCVNGVILYWENVFWMKVIDLKKLDNLIREGVLTSTLRLSFIEWKVALLPAKW